MFRGDVSYTTRIQFSPDGRLAIGGQPVALIRPELRRSDRSVARHDRSQRDDDCFAPLEDTGIGCGHLQRDFNISQAPLKTGSRFSTNAAAASR